MAGGYAIESGFQRRGHPAMRIGNLYLSQLSLERQPIFLDESCLKAQILIWFGAVYTNVADRNLGKTDYGFAIIVDETVLFF